VVRRAVEAVSSLVGQRTIVLDGTDYGPGCAALVRAAFARAGRPLPADARDARAVLVLAGRRGAMTSTRRPSAGDLVFLSDGPGGPAEHVALVARAEPDGTIVVLHRVARGVRRVRMNLAYPDRQVDPATGKHINDMLLVGSRPLSAGSLVVGISDLLRRG
jgi:cell wall-associated NlpC family hydrolase